MAGLTLSAGVSAILGLGTPAILGQAAGTSEGKKPQPPRIATKEVKSSEPDAVKPSQPVELVFRIAGPGPDGCDIEIKPANPACRFRPLKRHVDASVEFYHVVIKDLEVRGADRNCSFAITVSETGQKPRTILRGFRLAARNDQEPAGEMQKFFCLLSSPSKLAKLEETTTRK